MRWPAANFWKIFAMPGLLKSFVASLSVKAENE